MTPFFLSLACRVLGHRMRVVDYSLALDPFGRPLCALGKCTRCGKVLELTHAEAREVTVMQVKPNPDPDRLEG